MSLRARIERIMRGEEPPGALAGPLWLAERLYAGAVFARGALYGAGILQARRADRPVISVGNLTVGGTGKTPLADLIAGELLAMGLKPGILSRGYGAKSRERVTVVSGGAALGPPPPETADEAYMLARRRPGVPVVCAPKRIEGARVLVERFRVDVIVLDDGFQHRALARDLDIVLLDGADPAGNGQLLPRGPLREPLTCAHRADLVVVNMGAAGRGAEEVIAELRARLNITAPMAAARGRVDGYRDAFTGEVCSAPRRAWLLLGVARPTHVRAAMEHAGLDVAGITAYPDHHHFTPAQLETARRAAHDAGAEAVVTTEKDAARLTGMAPIPGLPVIAAAWTLEIVSGADAWREALRRAAGNR